MLKIAQNFGKNKFLQNFRFLHVTKKLGWYYFNIILDRIARGLIKYKRRNKIWKSGTESPYLGILLYLEEYKGFDM